MLGTATHRRCMLFTRRAWAAAPWPVRGAQARWCSRGADGAPSGITDTSFSKEQASLPWCGSPRRSQLFPPGPRRRRGEGGPWAMCRPMRRPTGAPVAVAGRGSWRLESCKGPCRPARGLCRPAHRPLVACRARARRGLPGASSRRPVAERRRYAGPATRQHAAALSESISRDGRGAARSGPSCTLTRECAPRGSGWNWYHAATVVFQAPPPAPRPSTLSPRHRPSPPCI